jgi:tripartite-type tricarboxylate transporter receptor subunit TctC
MSIWAGIFAPRQTPTEMIETLAGALDKALDDAEVRDRLNALSGSIPGKTERNPEAFAAYVKAEVARWAPILKTSLQPN